MSNSIAGNVQWVLPTWGKCVKRIFLSNTCEFTPVRVHVFMSYPGEFLYMFRPMQSQRLLYNRPILDVLNCMYSSVHGSAMALRCQISKDTKRWIDQLVVWLGIVRVVRACRIILTVSLFFPHIGVHKCKGRIWLCSTTLFKNQKFSLMKMHLKKSSTKNGGHFVSASTC